MEPIRTSANGAWLVIGLVLLTLGSGCHSGQRATDDQTSSAADLGATDLHSPPADAEIVDLPDLGSSGDGHTPSDLAGTPDGVSEDTGSSDATSLANTDGASGDAEAPVPCSVNGVAGTCIDIADCAAKPGYGSTPGFCPGPTEIQCCTQQPNIANNPPVPAGWKLMKQADVTSEMTAWAIEILHDPATYPMFSTTTRVFGALTVLARVEWHPPDFNNGKVHRGVTLYQPI